ncbi:hypothetical protein HHI36_011847 [Cryptolaemus montrouzieri]|uniref:BESS domain-containing protein n=1 Tax=Cryptolaemus montrouzieri TaxID=559131 RepID=A0ABD2NCS5_9CUCU
MSAQHKLSKTVEWNRPNRSLNQKLLVCNSSDLMSPREKSIKLNSQNSRSSTHSPNLTPNTPSAKAKMLHNLEERSNERMRLVPQLVNQKKEEHDVDLFMKSIALILKKLPPNSISQANVQRLISEVLLQILLQQKLKCFIFWKKALMSACD